MPAITDDMVQAAFDRLRDSAGPAAKAKAERLYIEAFIPAKKNLLMKEIDETVFGMTVAAQERDAMAHPDYIEQLGALRIAVYNDELLRNQRDNDKALIEAWRTQEATMRAARI
jgi:hypothetical protein